MTDITNFRSHAQRTLAHNIAETGVNAGLFKAPETIVKTLWRCISVELNRLGFLLRRLIFLMALQVELAPIKPRPDSNYLEKADGEPKGKPSLYRARSEYLRHAPRHRPRLGRAQRPAHRSAEKLAGTQYALTALTIRIFAGARVRFRIRMLASASPAIWLASHAPRPYP